MSDPAVTLDASALIARVAELEKQAALTAKIEALEKLEKALQKVADDLAVLSVRVSHVKVKL